jgi:alanyl-tRNA synthetase
MHSRAPAEPYTRQFETTVEAVDGTSVVLEETYFYPEGGGQPADRGYVDGVEVIDVQTVDGDVVHELATRPEFEPDDDVEGAVDPAFRTYCMRAHTASHVLYGAGRRLLDDLGYGGFGITDEKVRVDFTTSTEIDDETLVELERLVNRAVWDSREVTWEELPRADALERDAVAFNTKTEEGVTGETVRVVTIEGWDDAACGGTHVRNTREIGPVRVLERSNPGEGLTRVEFAVGPQAIRQRATERRAAMAAARRLDTSVEDLPDGVERLESARDDLEAELDALRGDIVDSRLAELQDETVSKAGQTWLVGDVPGLDANGLSDRAQELVGDQTDVVALVSEDGQYLAVATAGDVDAGTVVESVTDEFGGGGGGSSTVAQGGGLQATAGEIVAFLREEQ